MPMRRGEWWVFFGGISIFAVVCAVAVYLLLGVSFAGILYALTFALVPVGAILFRIRGGLFDLGSTTVGRLIWSVGMAMLVVIASVDWRAIALAPALFVGCVLPWWGSIDMGRNEGSRALDALLQTARGVLWVIPAVGVILWIDGRLGAALVAVSGLLCAPAYELGWRIPSRVRGFAQGAELGEVFFGAAIGAGLAAALLT